MEKNTHACLYASTLLVPGSLLSMTEASEMTIKKSKTVAFENRAGDLTALYCMSDWMIAVVLAIIAMMSVWAALIIYRSIQTLKGPRRKVEDETGKETTTEEAPLSCVESTGKSTFYLCSHFLIGYDLN